MASQYIQIPPVPDRTLFRFFLEAARILETEQFTVNELGQTRAERIAVDGDEAQHDGYLASSDLFTIYSASVSGHNYSLSFSRSLGDPKSPAFDQLRIDLNTNETDRVPQEKTRRISRLISETFFASPEQSSRLFLDPRAAETLIASHQTMLVRLQETAARATESIFVAKTQLDAEFERRAAKLEDEFLRRRELQERELTRERATISELRKLVERREKELDDRDHVHVRRELREKITNDISNRLSRSIVPLRTSAISWIVLSLSLAGALFLGWLSFASLSDYFEIVKLGASARTAGQMQSDISAINIANAPSTWVLLARGFLAGLGAIGFLVYSLSWLKNIYQSNVRAHQELERYAIDLNRASWAVETTMEAKAAGGTIPDMLIAGISHNLFGQSVSEKENSASEAIASLLRASAGAKIGPNGAELQFNGRGTTKLADKIEE